MFRVYHKKVNEDKNSLKTSSFNANWIYLSLKVPTARNSRNKFYDNKTFDFYSIYRDPNIIKYKTFSLHYV